MSVPEFEVVSPFRPAGDQPQAIAGLVDHHLSVASLPIPDWVADPARTLSKLWHVTGYTDLAEVPEAFLRHGVALAASELASVWPRLGQRRNRSP